MSGACEISPSHSDPCLAIPEVSRSCDQGLVAGGKGSSELTLFLFSLLIYIGFFCLYCVSL